MATHSDINTEPASVQDVELREHEINRISPEITVSHPEDPLELEIQNLYQFAPTTLLEKIRKVIYLNLEYPSYSKLAGVITSLVLFLIVFSTVTFCLESLPIFFSKDSNIWFIFESTCVISFTIEYLMRVLCCPKHIVLRYLIRPLNVIDLLAILPYWFELFLGGTLAKFAVLRVIRLTRVLRIFKLGRHAEALQKSKEGMSLLFFFLGIGVIVFSSMVYFAEQVGGYFDEKTEQWKYSDGTVSIPDSMWWCIVTMTTVGYGDMFPITWTGKIVGVLAMLSGILIIAFPVAILSSKFLEVFVQRKREEIEKEHQQRTQGLDDRHMFYKRRNTFAYVPKEVLDVIIQKDELGLLIKELDDKLKDTLESFEYLNKSLALITPDTKDIVKE